MGSKQSVEMGNNNMLDDAFEAKKYLEEVMGIVEDEEFYKKRLQKLKALKKKQKDKKNTLQEPKRKLRTENQNIESKTSDSFCIKILFGIILISFTVTSLVIFSDYTNDDHLQIRKLVREDTLKIGYLLHTPAFPTNSWSLSDTVVFLMDISKDLTNKLFNLCSHIVEIMNKYESPDQNHFSEAYPQTRLNPEHHEEHHMKHRNKELVC